MVFHPMRTDTKATNSDELKDLWSLISFILLAVRAAIKQLIFQAIRLFQQVAMENGVMLN